VRDFFTIVKALLLIAFTLALALGAWWVFIWVTRMAWGH